MNINYVTGLDVNDDRVVSGLEFLIDTLPHGSGIDCGWSINAPKNGRYVYFSNSYHCMDDNGYYVGYQDFTIVIPAFMVYQLIEFINYTDKTMLHAALKFCAHMFTLQFNGDRYLSERYDLRDYLTDTVYHALYFAGDSN
jgi:hypothetical protein